MAARTRTRPPARAPRVRMGSGPGAPGPVLPRTRARGRGTPPRRRGWWRRACAPGSSDMPRALDPLDRLGGGRPRNLLRRHARRPPRGIGLHGRILGAREDKVQAPWRASRLSEIRKTRAPSRAGGTATESAGEPGAGRAVEDVYWLLPVSSRTLPARSTLILIVAPGARPANWLRIFSMLSSDTTGMSLTDRMMSPPTGISFPPMVRIPSLPCTPMFHAVEPWATVLTRKPAGAGTSKTVARRPVSSMPWKAPQKTFRGSRSFCALLIVTTKPRPSLPPDLEMFWLTLPMTSPAMLKTGPPEFPVLMVAVVWRNSAKGMSGKMVLGGQRALSHPTLIEYASP